MTLLQSGLAKSLAEDYTIDQSLRFNDGDSAYLSRTPGSTGNRQVWTFSAWVKRGTQGSEVLFHAGTSLTGNSGYFDINFQSDGTLKMTTGSTPILITDAVYRDSSAWYHVVAVNDSGTFHFYVNGVEPSYSTNVGLGGTDTAINNTVITHVGVRSYVSGSTYTDQFFDGYLAEVYFIDGAALDADSFGETDSTTNQWKPLDSDDVKDAVTFGTNGFYQKYASTVLANSFEDSVNHVAHTVTANGDVHTDTTVKKIGTASAEFDGTGDYLTIPSSGDFGFGASSDFTLELWFYRTASDTYPYILDGRTAGGEGNYPTIYLDSTDSYKPVYYTNSSARVTSSATTTTSTWYHLAIVRASGTTTMYLDGSSVGTWSDSTTYAACPLTIGDYSTVGTYEWTGYMDEIRISNTARYTRSFAPSTTEFTADKYTRLLLHCDGADSGTTFTDSSWTGAPRHIITPNGNVANTRAQSKVGDSSIVFDGTGDFLTIPNSSDFHFGTGDFTIEFWVYQNASSGMIMAAQSAFQFYISSGTLAMYCGDAADNYDNISDASFFGALANDTWQHIAFVRSGTTFYGFVDGTAVSTDTGISATVYAFTSIVGIGEHSNGSYVWDGGYLDEIRISDTARYTGTFTPSTTEFTTDSNTKLLIHSNWTGGLGADSSGNGNVFAVTNLVATDQMEDSPTNNFCTMNPLAANATGTSSEFNEGNLRYQVDGGLSGNWDGAIASTFGMTSGKWYWESYSYATNLQHFKVGVTDELNNRTAYNTAAGVDAYGIGYHGGTSGQGAFTITPSTTGSYISGSATGQQLTSVVIGYAYDADNGDFYVRKGGGWVDSSWTETSDPDVAFVGSIPTTDTIYIAYAGYDDSTNISHDIFNFGQDSSFAGNVTAQGNQDGNSIGDFYYEPPSGYLALCTSNLSAPEIADPTDHFNTKLYTGDGATTLAVTGVGFAPDFTWIKNRDQAADYTLVDEVRGATKYLVSNDTDAEVDDNTFVASLDSDGFTVGDDAVVNTNTKNYVSWNWKGDGVSGGTLNEDGTIDSQVNVNTTAGFSIATYTGQVAAGTVGHGLAQAPELVIGRPRDDADAWRVGSDFLTSWVYYLKLNDAVAETSNSAIWNSAAPTSSVFNVGTDGVNGVDGRTYVAYCFHSVEGYSKIGTYEGNGDADGIFIYTGFKPSYVLIKDIDNAYGWHLFDDARDPYNAMYHYLRPSDDAAEGTTPIFGDFVSNGFKLRTGTSGWNDSSTHIYIAFAESPFKTSNAR